ncbi:hypothetical protein BV898_15812 [Hypsibius exemplaris]|uniref:SET domain-containing protein n=1 Tax=Hypsibius exemplaris TaxID=2072580 RepID=A0A9X6NCC6_HYPEX|nr:hypothetical protein BV898_15812 [Hypsibius exemplaris]
MLTNGSIVEVDPHVWSTKPRSESEPPSVLAEARFSQLALNAKAHNLYLVVRTVAPPVVVTPVPTMATVAVHTVVDHPTNGTVVLVLPYFLGQRTMCHPEEQPLQLGTVLLLKEPMLQVSSSTPGTFILRCDSPSDVVVRSLWSSPLWPAPHASDPIPGVAVEGSQERGGLTQQWKAAMTTVDDFRQGDSTEDYEMFLYSKLAEENYCAGHFEKTIEFAEMVLNNPPLWLLPQVLHLAGRAHYELRHYVQAHARFERLSALPAAAKTEQHHENGNELERCRERLSEARKGIPIHKLHPSQPDTYLDVADFTGPIHVAKISGKGRGLVASTDILPGTQIMVNKAFRASFRNDNHRLLITEIGHAITSNPTTYTDMVYDLTANDVEKDGRRRFSDPAKKDPIVDVDRLRGIIAANAFALTQDSRSGSVSGGSGLFVAAAYFNHACVPNAMWMVYCDVLVVHAIKLIEKGQEVTIPYFSPSSGTWEERTKRLAGYGFTCDCVLCQLDRTEPEDVWRERKGLLEEGHSAEMVRRLEETFAASGRTKLRLSLYKPLLREFDSVLKRGLLPEALELLRKAMDCLGISLQVLLECGERDDAMFLEKDAVWCSELNIRLADLVCFYCSCQGLPEDIRMVEARRFLAALEVVQRVVYGNSRSIVRREFDKIPGSLFC